MIAIVRAVSQIGQFVAAGAALYNISAVFNISAVLVAL